MNDPLKVVNSTKLKVNPYGDKLDLLRGLTTMFDPPPPFIPQLFFFFNSRDP